MVIKHQAQPTTTSCGPTCVAMIINRPVEHVLGTLKDVRSIKRNKKRGHNTNITEIMRLLEPYGFALERRVDGLTWVGHRFGLLRVHHPRKSGHGYRTGWHWCVLADNYVYDPLLLDSMDANRWLETYEHKIYFYPVRRIDGQI